MVLLCLGVGCGDVCDHREDVAKACAGDNAWGDGDREACERAMEACSDSEQESWIEFYACVEEESRCNDGIMGKRGGFTHCEQHLQGMSSECADAGG